MKFNILEKAMREAKGGNVVIASAARPVEHKDLSSLSMQIAANLRANGNAASTTVMSRVYRLWI